MFNEVILQLEVVIREYGTIGVFFAAILEEVVAPIPSSLVAMFAGFFLLPTEYTWLEAIGASIFKVAIAMSLGITIGSLLFYAIAYFGGKPIILRYGKWFGLSWELIEKTEAKFIKGHTDEVILLTLRSLPFVPSVAISAFCGLVRYPLKTFIVMSFAGSLVRSSIMALIGWQVREAYLAYAGIVSRIEKFVFFTIILIIVFFLVKHLYLRIKAGKTAGLK